MTRALLLLAALSSPALAMAAAAAGGNAASPQTHALVHGALFLAAVGATAGAIALLTWACAPVREAKRLAKEVDPAQENAYDDPSASDR